MLFTKIWKNEKISTTKSNEKHERSVPENYVTEIKEDLDK